ncbi:hypothetical protein BJV78DRAFT_405812 [Lactifluus subvellereus]|nr:hypothetical protein BJV78DRAFT_405812 [Lactifluus subvellereus]
MTIRPSTTAAVAAKVKPITVVMAALEQKLEPDEEADVTFHHRAVPSRSDFSERMRRIGPCSDLIRAVYLRLYISDTLGLAFIYDPILLESAITTFVVEWGEITANQNSRKYIANATEEHTELHTFIYAPRKDGWHYLGQ